MKHNPESTRHRTVLSLYTGAGGLDLGLEAAGFEVALCVEMDEDCRKTLASNRPSWRLSEPGDIHGLTPEQAMRQANLQPGEVTLLAGGPPCQPFSKSGYWADGDARRLEDPRSATLGRYLDFVEAILPRVLLLENVKGLIFNGKDEGLRLLESRLKEINQECGVGYKASVEASTAQTMVSHKHASASSSWRTEREACCRLQEPRIIPLRKCSMARLNCTGRRGTPLEI